MITRTLNDVNVVQQAFIMTIQMILPVPVMCMIGVIMAFSIDTYMSTLLIIVTAIVLIGAVFITRKTSLIFEKQYEETRMRRPFEDYAESSIKANRLFFGLESLAFFIMNICIVGILWLGGNQIGTGQMEIGDITALTEYSVLILFHVIMAQMVIINLPRAKVCIKRISDVISHKPEIRDGLTRASATQLPDVSQFQSVDFLFADADEATLQNLDFSLRRGETTAIIGSTGSGKSTIAKLLLRFHDASKGIILLNGEDVRNMTQQELRQQISYVPQKAWLFSGTIADNLRYGNENATEEDMLHALAEEAKNSAVLIIAQRVNTIINAEQIIVLEDGKTVGIGIHKQLIETCPIYRDIAKSQPKGGELNGK